MLDCARPVRLSKMAENERDLNLWVYQWERDYIAKDPLKYLDLYSAIYAPSGADISEFGWVQPEKIMTLKQENVKSLAEKRIADWLFVNGIPYEYEGRYITKKRISMGFDYKPDFKISDSIYIEFFGIDRKGNTRSDIDKAKYNDELNKKIKLHKEMGTNLIDLYLYELSDDTLFQKLKKKLLELDVHIKPRDPEEIKKILIGTKYDETKTPMSEILSSVLNAIRIERLDHDGVLKRLKDANFVTPEKIADFLMELHDDYVHELRKNEEIDFNDMILEATTLVNEGKWKPPYKHILIDEFQDISSSRYELVKSIIEHCDSPTSTMVGDDWQAIYRFAGGKLEITTRFGQYFGRHTLTLLDKTFRYPSGIANLAGEFVMKNPEQYKKSISTVEESKKPVIHLLDYNDAQLNSEWSWSHDYLFGKKQAKREDYLDDEEESPDSRETEDDKVKRIADKEDRVLKLIRRTIDVCEVLFKNRPNDTIAIMSRYNYYLSLIRKAYELKDKKQVSFWTFHRAKGLEADYTIIVGLDGGSYGFPCSRTSFRLIEALLPTQDPFLYSEERRLFYVGLTRARKHCYILGYSLNASEFINEILAPKYNLDIRSSKFEADYRKIFKCPTCKNGYFELKTGKFGDWYECNSGLCQIRPRICKSCGAPMVDGERESVCQNPNCRNRIKICPVCGRPMALRTSIYGKFWGCTGYGIQEDRCTHKEKYTKGQEQLYKLQLDQTHPS